MLSIYFTKFLLIILYVLGIKYNIQAIYIKTYDEDGNDVDGDSVIYCGMVYEFNQMITIFKHKLLCKNVSYDCDCD